MKMPALPRAACLDPSALAVFDRVNGDGARLGGWASRAAKRICLGCPERRPCLEWALHHAEGGVWGGREPIGLGRLRAQRGIELEKLTFGHDLRGAMTGGNS